jgi:hypothetical protein
VLLRRGLAGKCCCAQGGAGSVAVRRVVARADLFCAALVAPAGGVVARGIAAERRDIRGLGASRQPRPRLAGLEATETAACGPRGNRDRDVRRANGLIQHAATFGGGNALSPRAATFAGPKCLTQQKGCCRGIVAERSGIRGLRASKQPRPRRSAGKWPDPGCRDVRRTKTPWLSVPRRSANQNALAQRAATFGDGNRLTRLPATSGDHTARRSRASGPTQQRHGLDGVSYA